MKSMRHSLCSAHNYAEVVPAVPCWYFWLHVIKNTNMVAVWVC